MNLNFLFNPNYVLITIIDFVHHCLQWIFISQRQNWSQRVRRMKRLKKQKKFEKIHQNNVQIYTRIQYYSVFNCLSIYLEKLPGKIPFNIYSIIVLQEIWFSVSCVPKDKSMSCSYTWKELHLSFAHKNLSNWIIKWFFVTFWFF